jgi:hypothetical protein
MRVRAPREPGSLRWLRRAPLLIGIVSIGLAVGACGSPSSGSSGTAKTSVPGAASASDTGGSGISSGGSPRAGSASSLPVCQTPQLKIAIGRTGAVAGMSGGDLEFRNTGRSACQLVGWPAVAGVTASGTMAAAVPVHSTQFGPFNGGTVSAVRLNAGATAGVAFIVGANNCTDTYQSLRVTPPGNTQSVVVSAWLPQVKTYLPACAPINVSPLVIASQLPNPTPQA